MLDVKKVVALGIIAGALIVVWIAWNRAPKVVESVQAIPRDDQKDTM